jgi:hypothetical protein
MDQFGATFKLWIAFGSILNSSSAPAVAASYFGIKM